MCCSTASDMPRSEFCSTPDTIGFAPRSIRRFISTAYGLGTVLPTGLTRCSTPPEAKIFGTEGATSTILAEIRGMPVPCESAGGLFPGCSCLRGRRTHHADPRGSPCLTAKSFGCVPFTRGKKRPRQNGDLKNGPFESRLLCPQPMRSCCFPPCILPRRSRHFAASVAHAAACTRCAPNSRSEQGCCVTALSQV